MKALLLSVGLILAGCEGEVIWDCTEQSTKMSEWVEQCSRARDLNACTLYAQYIFCKPVTTKTESK